MRLYRLHREEGLAVLRARLRLESRPGRGSRVLAVVNAFKRASALSWDVALILWVVDASRHRLLF
jgi:hypothetical protein